MICDLMFLEVAPLLLCEHLACTSSMYPSCMCIVGHEPRLFHHLQSLIHRHCFLSLVVVVYANQRPGTLGPLPGSLTKPSCTVYVSFRVHQCKVQKRAKVLSDHFGSFTRCAPFPNFFTNFRSTKTLYGYTKQKHFLKQKMKQNSCTFMKVFR